jgi:hypothetical protein
LPKKLLDLIIVDTSKIPKRAILLYNDLRESSYDFNIYFDSDGFTMLRETIHSMDTNWSCANCSEPIIDENNDSIACDYCFNWSHYVCIDLTKKEAEKLSKWFCCSCT